MCFFNKGWEEIVKVLPEDDDDPRVTHDEDKLRAMGLWMDENDHLQEIETPSDEFGDAPMGEGKAPTPSPGLGETSAAKPKKKAKEGKGKNEKKDKVGEKRAVEIDLESEIAAAQDAAERPEEDAADQYP